MRNVRRIDVPNALAADIDDLAVGEPAGRSITQIIERNQTTECTMRDLGARRRDEKLVHRPAFVRLHVSESDPSDSLERNDAGYRLGHQRKHAPRTGMKEKRLVRVNQELIERETTRRGVRYAR